MRKNITWLGGLLLALVLVLGAGRPALAATEVRVLLSADSAGTYAVGIETGEYELRDGKSGSVICRLTAGDKLEIRLLTGRYTVSDAAGLITDGLSEVYLAAGDEEAVFQYQNILYRGNLRLVQSGASAYAINQLDLEYYLYGVVGKEIGYNVSLEATKAQAVASRSYALAQLKPDNPYYDVMNTTASQVYGGYTAEKEAAKGNVVQAVDATAGQVLCYQGKVMEGNYHSNAGGHTENIENVWNGTIPLKGVPSPYDRYAQGRSSAGTYEWQVELTAAELKRLAASYNGTDIGSFVELKLSTTGADGKPTASGRITEATIVGTAGKVTAKKDDIRRLLGGLKSTLFTAESLPGSSTVWLQAKGQAPQEATVLAGLAMLGAGGVRETSGNQITVVSADGPTTLGETTSRGVKLSGKGYGHGVGMSQWGAIGMAADGHTYKEILALYYNLGTNANFTLESR